MEGNIMSNLDDKFKEGQENFEEKKDEAQAKFEVKKEEIHENFEEKKDEVQENFQEKKEEAQQNFEEKKEDVKAGVDKTVSEIKDGAGHVKEEVREAGEHAKDKFQDVKEQVKTGVNQTVEDVKSASNDDNNKAVIMHILSIFFGFISPLIFYFALSDTSEFLKEEAKRDLNFQIAVAIGVIIGLAVPVIGWLIILPLVAIANLVFEILALLKAKEGEHYKFPFTLNLIK